MSVACVFADWVSRMSEPGPSEASNQHLCHLLAPDTGGSSSRGTEPSPAPNSSHAADAGYQLRDDYQRPSRSTSTGPGEPRSRSRSPRTRRYGASGTITEIPQRSRSPTPTRMNQYEGYSPTRNHVLPRGMYSLSPPEITYDEVSTTPNSPTDGIMLQDIRMFGSAHQLHNKAVMVTQSGSLLAVSQSPLELRESTLTVNYPDCGGKWLFTLSTMVIIYSIYHGDYLLNLPWWLSTQSTMVIIYSIYHGDYLLNLPWWLSTQSTMVIIYSIYHGDYLLNLPWWLSTQSAMVIIYSIYHGDYLLYLSVIYST